MIEGAPGETYVSRPAVTGRGAPTAIQRSWVSPPQTTSRSPANYKPNLPPVQPLSLRRELLTRPMPGGHLSESDRDPVPDDAGRLITIPIVVGAFESEWLEN
jgi:hypothetical protein